MKFPFRRRREAPPPTVEEDPPRQSDTGGREARERAERALADVRERREANEALGRWFRTDAIENHYARDLQDLLMGRKP